MTHQCSGSFFNGYRGKLIIIDDNNFGVVDCGKMYNISIGNISNINRLIILGQ